MPQNHKGKEYIKGIPIKFGGGKYFGKTGWMNDYMAETAKRYYVIIDDTKAGEKEHLIVTFVSKKFVVSMEKPPSTYEEAAFLQYPNLMVALDSLNDLLARASIYPNKNLADIHKTSLMRSHARLNSMAMPSYFRIIFDGPPPNVVPMDTTNTPNDTI